MSLTTDREARKNTPMARGLLDYFPDALAYVAYVSQVGNDQHNPGQPLHWAKEKSTDHADCIIRHLVDRGSLDSDDVRHTGKVAWRALALLQTELENAKKEKYRIVPLDGDPTPVPGKLYVKEQVNDEGRVPCEGWWNADYDDLIYW